MTTTSRAPRTTRARPTPRWLLPGGAVVALVVVVLGARGLRSLAAVQGFVAAHPGTTADTGAPVGIPAWLAWQHGLNVVLVVFVARTGWLVRTTRRPSGTWTRRTAGAPRTRHPPVRISLEVWAHLAFDALFVLNGIVFYVLLLTTGQWRRIVPTSWAVVPDAASTALQYASLDWPAEHGWAAYNALQVLSYFLVVFVAAPLALLSGLRTTPGLARQWRPLAGVFPLEAARRLHRAVAVFFVAFVVVHVVLVLATGPLANLNHMYAARSGSGWLGLGIFTASLALMAALWVALSPVVVRSLAALTGSVGR